MHRILTAMLCTVLALQLTATSVTATVLVDEMPSVMRDAYIRAIQEELTAHGYYAGPADGIVGRHTINAIRLYQRDADLPIDGHATDMLLNHLKFAMPKIYAAAPFHEPTASPRRRYYAPRLTADTQMMLNHLGYYTGPIDGITGPRTQAAVRRYQRDHGLPLTGELTASLTDHLRQTRAEGFIDCQDRYHELSSCNGPRAHAAAKPEPRTQRRDTVMIEPLPDELETLPWLRDVNRGATGP